MADDKLKEQQNQDALKFLAMLGGGVAGGLTGYKLYDLYDKNRDSAWIKTVNDQAAQTAKRMARDAGKGSFAKKTFIGAVTNMDKAMGNKARANADDIIRDFSPGSKRGGKITPKGLAGLAGTLIMAEAVGLGVDAAIQHGKKHVQQQYANQSGKRDKRAELIDALLEKEASSPKVNAGAVGQRVLNHKVVQQALNTSAFLFPTAGVSYLVGRNLYGGMEKVLTPEDLNKVRVQIDVPNHAITGKQPEQEQDEPKVATEEERLLWKIAMRKVAEEIPPEEQVLGTTDKLRNKMNNSKFWGPVNNWFGKNDYKGPKDLAWMMTEGLPSEAIRGLAYATPMVAAYALWKRNPKAGFAPIKDTPSLDHNNSRVTIEMNPSLLQQQQQQQQNNQNQPQNKPYGV